MKHKLVFASLLLIASSCLETEKRVDINCEYKGAIVYAKHDLSKINGRVWYDIKYNGEILEFVDVYEIDNNYKVGDTINRPCR